MGSKVFGAIIAIAAIALAGPLATALGFGSSGLGFLLARTVIAMGIQALGSSVLGLDRKSTRLNSSHTDISRMPSSA